MIMKGDFIKSIISVIDTEKTRMLTKLSDSESNACIRKFKRVKLTFSVADSANKVSLKRDIVALYKALGMCVAVEKVNIIAVKPKKKGRRGRKHNIGFAASKKKAIVTFKEGAAPSE